MIDGVKITTNFYNKEHFLNNPLLQFNQRLNLNTGELTFPYYTKYKGLQINIRSNNFIEITGSLHKYLKDGENFGDFTFIELCAAIDTLCRDLKIETNRWHVNNLEIGVNVILPFAAQNLLARLICCKNKPFNRYENSIGLYCTHFTQKEVKFYSKFLQGVTKTNSFRVEYKAKKMQSIGGTILLSDLYDLDQIKWLSNELTKICKDSLIIDQSIDISQLTKCESELYLNGINPNYWTQEHKKNRKSCFKLRKRFDKILSTYGRENFSEVLTKLVENKITEMLEMGDVLTDLPKDSYLINGGRSYSLDKGKECHPVRICLTCGRDISKQDPNSKFCSESLYGREGKKCRNTFNNKKYKIKRIERGGVLFPIAQWV